MRTLGRRGGRIIKGPLSHRLSAVPAPPEGGAKGGYAADGACTTKQQFSFPSALSLSLYYTKVTNQSTAAYAHRQICEHPLYNFSELKFNTLIIPRFSGNEKGKRIMKKMIAITLAALLMLTCFAGCKKNNKETIVVGYTIYAPMNYLDENGDLIGFDTDLAKAVFENMGYEVIFKEIDWNSKYTDLASGNIDCVWNGFTCNTADGDGVLRSEKVDFSYNYMENRQVVVAKKDAGISSAEDLKGKVAAVDFAGRFLCTHFCIFQGSSHMIEEHIAPSRGQLTESTTLGKNRIGSEQDGNQLSVLQHLLV